MRGHDYDIAVMRFGTVQQTLSNRTVVTDNGLGFYVRRHGEADGSVNYFLAFDFPLCFNFLDLIR